MKGFLFDVLCGETSHGLNATSANSHAGNRLQVYILSAECFIFGVASVRCLLRAFRAHVTDAWHRGKNYKLQVSNNT